MARSARLGARANTIAKWVFAIPKLAVFSGLIAATLLTFPWNLPALNAAIPSYARTALLLLLFAFTVYASFFGTPLRDMLARLESRLSTLVRDWLE